MEDSSQWAKVSVACQRAFTLRQGAANVVEGTARWLLHQ
jgi:hypothetical protein